MTPMAKIDYTKVTEKYLNGWPVIFQWINVGLFVLYYHLRYRLRITGREHIPQGSFILVSNHSSYNDPLALAVAIWFHPLMFMAKKELFESKIMGLYLHYLGAFSVNREKLEKSTVRSALTVLKSGRWALGIFPEGTRSQNGELGSIKKGVAFFARAAKVPVLPAGILQTGPKNNHLYIKLGEPIPYQEDDEVMTEQVQSAIQALVQSCREEEAKLSGQEAENRS